MKVAHCQLRCSPGDLEANVAKVLAGLADAEREGAAIVSFPETFLGGYFRGADNRRANALTLDGPEIAGLLQQASGYSPTCPATRIPCPADGNSASSCSKL